MDGCRLRLSLSRRRGLTNDLKSEYDVMVGSDAIGMELNLYVSLLLLMTKTNENVGKSVVSYMNPSQILCRGLPTPLNIPNQTNSRPRRAVPIVPSSNEFSPFSTYRVCHISQEQGVATGFKVGRQERFTWRGLWWAGLPRGGSSGSFGCIYTLSCA